MWVRFSGKSEGSRDREDEKRKSGSSSTRRSKGPESVVSSSSARRPSGRESRSKAPESVASSYATFATARDDRDEMRSNVDLYDDPRNEERRRYRREDDERSMYSRKERSRSRDRWEKDKRKDRDKDKDKRERRKSRSEAGGSRALDIVEGPERATRSVSGQYESDGVSPYTTPGQPHMMSGALPAGTMSSHVPDQFPGQDPTQFARPFMHGPVHTDSFGEAADYYGDMGDSVQHQPGVRIERPSVIMPLDTPHLMSASSQANPVADTGSGAAADFFGTSNVDTPPSKPPRPSSMPGAFTDDGYSPQKPPRPSSKPDKPGKINSGAMLAGAAGLGHAFGHNSSHEQHADYTQHNTEHADEYSTSYTNGAHGAQGASANMYYHGDNPSSAATNGNIPTYSEAMADVPPQKPPRPGKPEKQPSGSSHAGLYAAGLAAYGLTHHDSHSNSHAHSHHHHTNSMPGGFPSDQYGGPAPGSFMTGGMAQMHEHKGPVNKFADWWKNYDDVRKMEEYTEYIGVCKGCFDPRSSPMDAPRKHYYGRKRSSEFRPSGIPEKQSRYGLSEKSSRHSLSGDERRDKRKSTGAASWIAAGLGGVGLASAGKALLKQSDDFDDTYSIKSGRDARYRVSRRSRSRSGDRKYRSSGRSEYGHRSRSRDRMSMMSVGVTSERKDHKFIRYHSDSRSRSSSRDRKSGLLGTAVGASLAASAVSASRRKHGKHSASRSRSNSPQKVFVHHRRDSSDYDRRHAKSQRVSRKSSRSSAGSFVDVSRTTQSQRPQGGFLGGFFSAPPAKEKRRKTHIHSKKKKKRGFFNFGNDSTSSSGSELAFGTGFVKRKQRPSRRTSDEKLNATLVGLGATAAAIAAAQAGRNKGKHRPEIVAVRDRRDHRRSSDRRRPGTSSHYGSEQADGWEDLPDDETSDSQESMSSGLAFGDYDWKKGKSTESLASNGSGTNKWGWRWGSKKQKKKSSSESLYNAGTSASFIGPATVGAVTGAAIGAGLNRHDSSASSVPTLQSVYPVASNDPTSFDARRTSTLPTPQPLVTSRPDAISIQQPQPVHQVPGAIYSTQAPPQPGYVVPSGPPVFSQYSTQQDYPVQHHDAAFVEPSQHPPLPRRANSSPIHSSSWKRDVAMAGVAAGIGAGAFAAMKKQDQSPSSSNVRFDFTPEQARKEEWESRKAYDRESDSDRRRRQDDEDAKERERRRMELQQQEDEARKYLEAERLAKLEIEHREAERKREREREERRAKDAREADERERHEREARAEAQRRADLDAEAEQRRRELQETERRDAERYANLEREAEQKRRERQEAERRQTERREAAERRELEIRADTERRRREREAEDYSQRYQSDIDRRTLEQQHTGSSVATDVRRKERELEERERDIVHPDTWNSTVAAATVAGAAAAITSAAISSSKHDERNIQTVSPPVKKIEPSKIAQDYADEDIFDRNIFKKKSNVPEIGSARDILQDWEDRYKREPVSQADFFAPKELLEHTAPSPKIDPNAGNTDIHVYAAHDDFDLGSPKTPPYPPSYSFTASKDGRRPSSPTWSVLPAPIFNLIEPTPPGSRANSVRGISLPPSPAIEPQPESKEEPPKQDEANRRGSRVSWGENQFHNYEVPTPDSYRESFVSSHDIQTLSKDEIIAKADSPEPGQRTKSYQPLQELEFPTSTQFVLDQEEDSRGSTMSKKNSKKNRKKAKAAAVAAAAVTTAAVLSKDEEHDTPSVVSDPFADKYAESSVQSSVQSSIPSTSSVYQSPHHDFVDNVSAKPSMSRDFVGEEVPVDAEPIHIPGSFDDDAVLAPPAEDEWASISKNSRKAKKVKKSQGIEDDSVALDTPKAIEPDAGPLPEPEPTRAVTLESEFNFSQRDKKLNKDQSSDSTFFVQGPSVAAEPVWRPEPETFRESTTEFEKPADDEWDVPTTQNKKGRKSKSVDEPFSTEHVPRTAEPEPLSELEPIRESMPEAKLKSSKKERKKKKAKAAKPASVDSWEESESSQPNTPTAERDIRDVESTYIAYSPPKTTDSSCGGGIGIGTPLPSGRSHSATKSVMAGGFAGLVASAMKQDQDRMASDLEHARKNLDSAKEYTTFNGSASTASNSTHGLDESEPRVHIPSTAFGDLDELPEVKTPRTKKRHSSGRWSPSVGSPLRSEVQYEDYVGAPLDATTSREELPIGPSKPSVDLASSDLAPATDRDVHDSGYYAPDDQIRTDTADRESDEFFSAGSDERKQSKPKSPSSDKYDDRDTRSVGSSRSKYDDELDQEERHRRRVEERSVSRDRSYEFEDSERKRRHRRRETDEQDDEWETKSTISEARSEANGERRRKHKRRDSERNGSPEGRPRSSAASDPGDLYERKSTKRRSKRDVDDDAISIVSSPARYDEERSSSSRKEKRSSGLFGLFSKSKENLADTSGKSSRSKSRDEDEDDHERRRHRRKKERGSTYGSDDDDTRSVVSTSSRRSDKRRSGRDDEGRKV
jgi:serine/arginine repetitive matrix protein 2